MWPNPPVCNFFCIDSKDSILFIDLIVEEIFIKILMCHYVISWMNGVQLWQNPMIYFITNTGIQNSRDYRKETIDKNLLNFCPESGSSPPARCEVHGHSASAGWESVTRQPGTGSASSLEQWWAGGRVCLAPMHIPNTCPLWPGTALPAWGTFPQKWCLMASVTPRISSLQPVAKRVDMPALVLC